MKKLIIVLLIGLNLALPVKARADDDLMHFAAHFGMSYALNTTFYAFYKRFFRLDEHTLLAHIMAAGTTLMIGYMYKFSESTSNGYFPANTRQAVFRNSLGIGASIVTIKLIEF